MTWFKVDDTLAFHAKVVQAGNAAMGLWVRAGSYCGQHLTDGFVSREVALTLGKPGEIKRLVASGLWSEVDGGYQFHQWDERQPSREEVEAKREAEAKKKADWRARKAAERAASKAGPEGVPSGHDEDNWVRPEGVPGGVPAASRSTRPDPTRPDPDSPNGESSPVLPRKRGQRIPDDFRPSDEHQAWARDRGFNDAQITEITETFTRHWQAASGANASKLDWPKAWQNWVAKEDPRRVRGVALTVVASDRPLTGDELTNVLGPDRWNPPPPPPGLTADERWEWDRQQRVAHIAERQAEARARMSGVGA